MKVYICSKCNQKIPRDEILQHRQVCGTDADIGLHSGLGLKFKRGFLRLLMLAATVVLLGAAYWLGTAGFRSLASMRRLERVPEVAVHAALPGEVQINGRIRADDRILRGPQSNVECVYFRYTVERQVRDSDGDTRWRTETDRAEFVPFVLSDETGEIRVVPDPDVRFRARQSDRTRRGDYRYTEYRLEPGASVFAFGFAVREDGGIELRFDREGDYDPVISGYGRDDERSRQGLHALLKCWGGLVLMAAALSLLLGFLRVHRVLVHFSLLTVLTVGCLVFLGLQMMKMDLRAAAERLERLETAVREELQWQLARGDYNWDGQWESLPSFGETAEFGGVPAEQLQRLQVLRLHLARSLRRADAQRASFPERWLALAWRIPRLGQIPLPAADRGELEKAESVEPQAYHSELQLAAAIVALLVAAAAFVLGFRRIRFKRCIENLPTTPTAGAACGLAEFKGLVELPENGQALTSPLTHTPCVHYHYLVKEKRGSGKKASWVTVVDQSLSRPFFCRDGEGRLLVDPGGARIYTTHRTVRRAGRTRYRETRLEPCDPLYAIGECVIEPIRGDRLYLAEPVDKYPFILGNFTEGQIMLREAAAGVGLLNLSFAGILLAALLSLGLLGAFKPADFLLAALGAPLFMILTAVPLHYNDLVFLRERLRRNRSNIDVSLKKRRNLVPALNELARGFMEHERSVQRELVALRNLYSQRVPEDPEGLKPFMEAENSALAGLVARVEEYPELKSNLGLAELMHSLAVLENEVAFMRNGYNDAVEAYNTRTQSFPDVVLARLGGFREEPFIHAETELVRLPPDLQALWEKDAITASASAAAEQAGESVSEAGEEAGAKGEFRGSAAMLAMAGDADGGGDRTQSDRAETAVRARIGIYALLINPQPEVRKAQLARMAADESPEIAEQTEAAWQALVAAADEVSRLRQAEEQYQSLRSMSPEGYRAFLRLLNFLIEADREVSLFQYALLKSIDRWLEPAFGGAPERPARHLNCNHILHEVSLVLSRLARSSGSSEERVAADFGVGVANLNHRPAADFSLLPEEQCGLGAFDEALEEIAHSKHMVKANLLYAAKTLVETGSEAASEQTVLLTVLADMLGQNRP